MLAVWVAQSFVIGKGLLGTESSELQLECHTFPCRFCEVERNQPMITSCKIGRLSLAGFVTHELTVKCLSPAVEMTQELPILPIMEV